MEMLLLVIYHNKYHIKSLRYNFLKKETPVMIAIH